MRALDVQQKKIDLATGKKKILTLSETTGPVALLSLGQQHWYTVFCP